MNHSHHLFGLELIEDRVLPSVAFISFNSGFADFEQSARFNHTEFDTPAFSQAPAFSDYYGRAFAVEQVVFRVQPGFDPRFIEFISNSFGSNQEPVQVALPSTTSAASTGQDGDSQADAAAAKTSAVQARITTHPRSDSTPTDDGRDDSVSLSVGSQSLVVARDYRGSDRPAEQAQIIQSQASLPGLSQQASSRISYPLIEPLNLEGTEGSAADRGVPSSESAEPPRAALPTLEQPPSEEIAATPNLPSPLPFAGIFPLDVAVIGTAATSFLGHVSDLTPEWPSDMPSFEDYFWTATAVLLAGGALRAAINRRTEQSKQRPAGLDSTLAEWEEKNAGRLG
jgi:hypothetical protein